MCVLNANMHHLDTMRLNELWTIVDMKHRLKLWL